MDHAKGNDQISNLQMIELANLQLAKAIPWPLGSLDNAHQALRNLPGVPRLIGVLNGTLPCSKQGGKFARFDGVCCAGLQLAPMSISYSLATQGHWAELNQVPRDLAEGLELIEVLGRALLGPEQGPKITQLDGVDCEGLWFMLLSACNSPYRIKSILSKYQLH